MKKIAAIVCVGAFLALLPGAVAGADPDTGGGGGSTDKSTGKAPPPANQTKTPVPAETAPAADSISDAPTSKLGSEPTGSLAPETKSTLAAEVARVDKDIAELTDALDKIHNDPAMPPEAVQAADAEVDVAVREQQIIHEIAVEEGFEPAPDTVPAPSVPQPPAAQPAVTRATVTGDLYAGLAQLDSRNAALPDPNQRNAQRARLAPLLDALRAAEASGDPQAIQNARAEIESANAATELAALEQVTAKLNADANRFLLDYTIPAGVITPQR